MRSAIRPLLLCATVILLPAAALASPWHVGARTGFMLANIHGDLPDLANPDNKLGFQGGGFVEYAPGPVAVALELTYVQKGARFEGSTTDDQGNFVGRFDSRLQLSYVEIPVLARVSLPLMGSMEPYAVLGPTFGIALGAKFESDAPGFTEQDLGDDLKSPDVGGTVGLGARLGHGLYRVAVETRYSTGFSDLWDISGNLDSINHGFGLTVGVAR